MLADSIRRTLIYYDVLDISLTTSEVFRYVIRQKDLGFAERPTMSAVEGILKQFTAEGIADERGGCYFLSGREYLVPLRLRHEEFFKKKWARAVRITGVLRVVPFIRGVFASGSLSLGSTDELSDLDMLVIARHGRIWLVRLLVLGLLEVFGIRRTHVDRIAPNKVCPNHFITDQSLTIPFHSIYTAQMYANLRPLFAVDPDLCEKFRRENEWLFHYLYHWQMPEPALKSNILYTIIRKIGEIILIGPIGDVAEWFARRLQTWLIERHRMSDNSAIVGSGHLVYDDTMLAFHEGSSEKETIDKYSLRVL